jgi:diadenosine tetraphosphate (Ap4A) HIT family hydrolase
VLGVGEIYELDQDHRRQLCEESTLLVQGLVTSFAADKIDLAALGNIVSQLNVQHIVRDTSDCAWPAPVWGSAPPMPYPPERLAELKTTLHSMLHKTFRFEPGW